MEGEFEQIITKIRLSIEDNNNWLHSKFHWPLLSISYKFYLINTVILLEPYCGAITESGLPVAQSYRRIFVYTFCLINICLPLSDDANKIKTLNIERA